MKLNNKGFTLVEILASVAILAILSGTAIMAVTRFQHQTRQKDYEAMETSAYNAAQNYIQETGFVVPSDGSTRTITIETLVNAGYLPELQDPASKGFFCHNGSNIVVSKQKSSGSKLEKYTYLVTIKCSKYVSTHKEGDVEKKGVYFYS